MAKDDCKWYVTLGCSQLPTDNWIIG